MFGLNMQHAMVGLISSHADAREAYDKAKPRRGEDPGDERRIPGKETSRQMGVRITREGNVAFRYHRTDVVTWYPDDRCVVETYTSRATCEFANRFLPMYTGLIDTGDKLRHGDWIYPIVYHATIYPDGTVAPYRANVRLVRHDKINRETAKRVLAKTNYAEYRKWYKVMSAMVEMPYPLAYISQSAAVEKLRDKAEWHSLMLSDRGQPDALRKVLYLYADAGDNPYEVEAHERLPADTKRTTRWRSTYTGGL